MRTVRAFCRDCFATFQRAVSACPSCRSRRTVCHDDLATLTIAHVDCDAFFAAVEKRDRPELRDVPVLIGGGERGVVSTACYLARIHGPRSAMPMAQARKLCPQAVVIRPNMEKYARDGLAIREMMRALTPSVEPLSIDEAFLDLSGTERLHGEIPAVTLARFAARVQREIGITVSVGLAPNKFLAKVASDLNKPNGYCVIGPNDGPALLATKSVDVIWGVGQAFRTRLAADGITRVKQLQAMDEADLVRRYGSMGLRLARLSRGIDHRIVKTERVRKSVSGETTFSTDLHRMDELVPILRRQAERVAASLKAKGLAGTTIVLKLKTSDFRLRTRNRALDAPTQLADRIFREARPLLAREADGTKFRLLGVGVSGLVADETADPDDLIDTGRSRRAAAERAMDSVRSKFGDEAVDLGLTFDRPRSRRKGPDVLPPEA